eukprot:6176130-Pleurochrysis_carterae.AAC.5
MLRWKRHTSTDSWRVRVNSHLILHVLIFLKRHQGDQARVWGTCQKRYKYLSFQRTVESSAHSITQQPTMADVDEEFAAFQAELSKLEEAPVRVHGRSSLNRCRTFSIAATFSKAQTGFRAHGPIISSHSASLKNIACTTLA